MISKELLSAVLGKDVKSGNGYIGCFENILTFAYSDEDMWSDINIHELAHMIKEWAKTNDYYISSWISMADTDGWVAYSTTNYKEKEQLVFDNTEPEAIFKAGELILKEISK